MTNTVVRQGRDLPRSSEDAEPSNVISLSAYAPETLTPKRPIAAQDQDDIVCFAAGTLIKTTRGEIAVEKLQQDDMVLTLDNGLQPIAWVGGQTVCGQADYAPIRFEAGVIGNDSPLVLSPRHRVLLTSALAQEIVGEKEVLIAAKHLVGVPGVTRMQTKTVSYHHILFDKHQVVFADGAKAESLLTGAAALRMLDDAGQKQVLSALPALADEISDGDPARRLLQSPKTHRRPSQAIAAQVDELVMAQPEADVDPGSAADVHVLSPSA